jgi:hypothetical protein
MAWSTRVGPRGREKRAEVCVRACWVSGRLGEWVEWSGGRGGMQG